MIAFFKNEQPIQYIALFFLAILFKLHLFFSEYQMVIFEGSTLFRLLAETTAFIWGQQILFVLITALILTHQAFLINKLNNRADFWSRGTSLPALFFLFFASAFVFYTYSFHPLLIGTYFVLYFLNTFIRLFEEYDAELTFYLGLTTGLASLFYFPFISFFGASLIFFMFYSNPPFKAYLLYVSGVFVPLFLAFTLFFFLGMFAVFFQESVSFYLSSDWQSPVISTEFLYISVSSLILFAGGLYSVYSNLNRMNVKVRTVWGILMLILIMNVFTLFLFTNGNMVYFYFISVVFCFFVSRFFFLFKRTLTGELIWLFLLLMILNFQYQLFIF